MKTSDEPLDLRSSGGATPLAESEPPRPSATRAVRFTGGESVNGSR